MVFLQRLYTRVTPLVFTPQHMMSGPAVLPESFFRTVLEVDVDDTTKKIAEDINLVFLHADGSVLKSFEKFLHLIKVKIWNRTQIALILGAQVDELNRKLNEVISCYRGRSY